MDFNLIKAFTLRNIYLTFRNLDRILNIFYWPFLNIIVWGITSIWVQKSAQFDNFLLIFLSVLIFWQITLRSGVDISRNLLDEIISKNLINIFVTPLDINEWIVASIFSSTINTAIMLLFSAVIVWQIYFLNIFTIGFFYSILFIISLIMSGWVLGFLLSGLVIITGRKGSDLLTTLGWLIAPFCAVYAPLKVLPEWLANIAYFFPMTYIFENIRSVLIENKISFIYIFISFVLNVLYLILSLLFFKNMFKKAKVKGLASID